MKGFLAVARREIVENRMALVAALISGVSPLAVPFVRNLHGVDAGEVRSLVAFFAVVTLAAGLSVALGVSTLSGGISSRQIGFFFARPLSSPTIWAGKLAGVAALALAAALLATLPTVLVSGGNLQMPSGWSLWPFLALSLLLIPISHAVSVALRSRTAWLALDLALLGLATLIAGVSIRALIREMAGDALTWGLIGLAIVLLMAFLAAGFAAVSLGRTDIHRAHRALSTFFWAITLSGVLLLAGYAHWVVSATPAEIEEAGWAVTAPQGPWLTVNGRARLRGGYWPSFVLDASSGRWWKAQEFYHPVVFSRDGRQAVWIEGDPDPRLTIFDRRGTWTSWRQPLELYRRDLTLPSATSVPTRIFVRTTPIALALSPDGSRIAVADSHEGSALSVYELDSGRSLGSVRLPYSGGARLYFAAPGRVRVFTNLPSAGPTTPGRPLQVRDFDFSAGRLSSPREIGRFEGTVALCVDPSGRRLLVRDFKGKRVELFDAETAERLATLSQMSSNADFLSDGRIAVAESGPQIARIRVFDGDGRDLRSIVLDAVAGVTLGGEIAPGQLMAFARRRADNWTDGTLFLVDIDRGEKRSVAEGLYPIASSQIWRNDDPSSRPAPGSEATKLFLAPGRSLVRFDPSTGERRVLLGGKDNH
ncbi:MAG: hypothetical protein ACRD00_01295 [Thermoanaerobaculia bacterium]